MRLVIEGLTSMGRFGMSADEIADLLSSPKTADVLISGRIQLEGLALHLPLTQPQTNHRAIPGARWHDAVVAPVAPAHLTARATEAWRWGLGWQVILADVSERLNSSPLVQGQRAVTAFTSAAALWVSHLDDGELGSLRAALPDIEMFPRIGTRLWLGDRAAFRAQGTVLAVNQVSKGTAAGYRQRRAPGNGAILVIGGGTAHGVALSAPSNVSSVRQRAVAAGTGVLEAAGRSLSPFIIDGSQRGGARIRRGAHDDSTFRRRARAGRLVRDSHGNFSCVDVLGCLSSATQRKNIRREIKNPSTRIVAVVVVTIGANGIVDRADDVADHHAGEPTG